MSPAPAVFQLDDDPDRLTCADQFGTEHAFAIPTGRFHHDDRIARAPLRQAEPRNVMRRQSLNPASIWWWRVLPRRRHRAVDSPPWAA